MSIKNMKKQPALFCFFIEWAIILFIVQPSYLNTKPSFRAALFAMISLIAVSIPLLFELPVGVVIVFAVFICLRLGLLSMGIYQLKLWQTVCMLLGATVLVFQQLGTILGLQGGISFLLLLALLKSYEGKTKRDWQVLVVVMLFLLAGAILFSQELFTGMWILLCLMMMACTLSLLNDLTWQPALKQSLVGFLLTLLPMVVLFVSVPRKNAPLWGIPQNPTKQSTTGISDTMKPGSIGELVLSNEPAFSATFNHGFMPQQQNLYWRVMVMGVHDGNEWRAMRDFADTATPSAGHKIHYSMIIEDNKGRVPALDYPQNPRQRGMFIETGNVLRVLSKQGVRRLDLQASLTDELPHQLSKMGQDFYTKLPANSNPRTRELAQALYQQNNGNVEQFAQAAFNYFAQQGFTYTLKPPVLGSRNSTDQFLFNSKQGFCEHYADAFVVMMRAAGVPARVVVGYQGGEYNEAEQFWQIRSKDAHAWTEVWLPERQVWKRIDPTAAVSAVRIESGVSQALSGDEGSLLPNTGFWTRFSDQGRFYWQQWVVNYDDERQQSLFNKLGFDGVNTWNVLMVFGAGGALSLIPLGLWWRKSRQQDVIQPLQNGYTLLKRRLLGKQYPNIAAIAPMELRQILHDENRLNDEIAQLLDDFIQLNYASSTPSEKQAWQWHKRAKRIAKKYRLKESA
ncbi:DUF3488 and transglutaminase-like domain-containing protein [Kingella kingae]|uniref:transglutaminase family protein n=1 Tax=Kingella kingae TaxID=504 RepID=UPI00255048FA|nr:DUF3488 and transglutaminase-like domain-containing protein [Kingella kingae]MDK4528879.1 DUF3488 and transglutaminase-like domain-containing protein [Kingella kingae]MDK4543525.1 DUF3488 and transglutaminase-like domain-containing protein [Kingella kingae]MDK4563085.1 DUF3488 and transglutaminase-like domain-containing protein [Kingella kingae]MDK4603179.1 DUF3488 and transglutaminase-like domain-containing protein [Kingella kingae]MDK4633168.1 DUF3488 and transglutaminase-like domain-cont